MCFLSCVCRAWSLFIIHIFTIAFVSTDRLTWTAPVPDRFMCLNLNLILVFAAQRDPTLVAKVVRSRPEWCRIRVVLRGLETWLQGLRISLCQKSKKKKKCWWILLHFSAQQLRSQSAQEQVVSEVFLSQFIITAPADTWNLLDKQNQAALYSHYYFFLFQCFPLFIHMYLHLFRRMLQRNFIVFVHRL